MPRPEKRKHTSHLKLYKQVLKLPNGQALPIIFATAREAKTFWLSVVPKGKPGSRRGIGGVRRGNIVYLFSKKGGEPAL